MLSLYEGEWKYADEDQYLTTKAEIIKVKGHILYNMGKLWALQPNLLPIIYILNAFKKSFLQNSMAAPLLLQVFQKAELIKICVFFSKK